jgi:hypothetical protein
MAHKFKTAQKSDFYPKQVINLSPVTVKVQFKKKMLMIFVKQEHVFTLLVATFWHN